MSTLAELFVKLGLDSSEFEAGIDNAEKKGSTFGAKIGNILGKGLGIAAAGAATAIGAVGGMIASSIGPASDLAESTSKVGVVFGESSAAVLEWGKTTASSIGMSSNVALSAAGTYGNLFRAMGMTEDTSSEMSTSLVELAGDLASFNNMDPTAVLDALRSGLSGETEPLKRLGVNLNQAGVEAKAMALGLWDGEGAMSAAAKAQATYALVMEQTTLAQGDYARTANGLANTQRSLTATFEDIKSSIGAAFLPIVQQGAGMLLEFAGGLKDIIQSGKPLSEMMGDIGKLLGGSMGKITGMLSQILPGAVTMITEIAKGIVQAIPQLMPAVMQVIMGLVSAIIELLPMILETGLQIILSLALGIAEALPALIPEIVNMVLMMVTVLIENIPMLISAGFQIVIGLVNGIINSIPVIIEQLPVIMQAIVTALITALPLIFNAAITIIQALIEGIVANLPMLLESGAQAIWVLIQGIWTVLEPLVQAGWDLVKKLAEAIKTKITQIYDIGVELIMGFWEGLKSKFNAIMSGIGDFITSIIAKLKALLGISSPSKVMMGVGKNMMLGLEKGLTDYSGVNVDATLNAVSGIPAAVSAQREDSMAAMAFSFPTANEIGRAVAVSLMQMGAFA